MVNHKCVKFSQNLFKKHTRVFTEYTYLNVIAKYCHILFTLFYLKVDILHPLATLHYDRCHVWTEEVAPSHCAVLHDIVAVLNEEWPDVLHISSTNFRSWTSITLPYCYMSLTTYQSKFVLVGGRHPKSREVTDQLLTSATGEDWQPSLPPMPTKRYSTASISAPEFLVVAGGKGSDDRSLNVVEVLLGDLWNTVDPLPQPCWDMCSTLHDGNFYFTGGDKQENTIYTCSCTSLFSLCRQTNTDSKTTISLWKIFRAPWDTMGILSYSSRLISIDSYCTIRSYSSMRQSWVKTTSERRSVDASNCMAAAVLHTGELVIAHKNAGMYKVHASGKCKYFLLL